MPNGQTPNDQRREEQEERERREEREDQQRHEQAQRELFQRIEEERLARQVTRQSSPDVIEKLALERFTVDQIGASECRRILRDWFPRLRERVAERKGIDADAFAYEREIGNTFAVLENIRLAFSAIEMKIRAEESNYFAPRRSSRAPLRLWAWPTLSKELQRHPQKEWSTPSPADIECLADAIAEYIKCPWLHHHAIDGAAINALLFSELAEYTDEYRSGVLFGYPNLGHVLSDGDAFKRFWIGPVVRIVGFLAAWIMLPAIAVGLNIAGYATGARVVLGLWCVYVWYRLVMVPVRWRRRKVRRKEEVRASQIIVVMMKAWKYASGSVINPSRLKEIVLEAEQQGAMFRPVLHTLIDRAIQRDPTALVTRR